MDTFEAIRKWGQDRNINEADAQIRKFNEKWGELNRAITKMDEPNIVDGIGGCAVVLTILADMMGLQIEDCIEAAWDEIKDRRGTTIDGTFHKEGS